MCEFLAQEKVYCKERTANAESCDSALYDSKWYSPKFKDALT